MDGQLARSEVNDARVDVPGHLHHSRHSEVEGVGEDGMSW